MLSYQHEYHAGNHADVLKHAGLALTLGALQRKDTPLRVFDVHAGAGLYDLQSREARRNAEHEGGIERVLARSAPPREVETYLAAVRAANTGPKLRRYPGSPWLARQLLRPNDHLVLMERHPRALGALRSALGNDTRTHIHARDCFEGLPALVPPPERRGLVLIDPSYEVKEELAQVAELLTNCYARWPGGTYMIWYPLLRDRRAERFPTKIAGLGIRKIYRAELEIEAPSFDGMRGSGLLIVNLPFGLESSFGALLGWLWDTLSVQQRGSWQAGWLVPE